MNVTIQKIPHSSQRYPTPGDWQFDSEGNLTIRVSDLGDWRYEALMAIHELIEVVLCKHAGITEEKVDAFDIQFEKERSLGIHSKEAEPGDHKECPYGRQHFLATVIEELLAKHLDVDWETYNRKVVEL